MDDDDRKAALQLLAEERLGTRLRDATRREDLSIARTRDELRRSDGLR
jgi:hypothetical protein